MIESDLCSIDPATFGLDEGNIFKGACVPHYQHFEIWNLKLTTVNVMRILNLSLIKIILATQERDREGILHRHPIP